MRNKKKGKFKMTRRQVLKAGHSWPGSCKSEHEARSSPGQSAPALLTGDDSN